MGEFRTTKGRADEKRGLMVEHEEWIWTGIYTLLSVITRFWRIGAANYVVWDEVRTGYYQTQKLRRCL